MNAGKEKSNAMSYQPFVTAVQEIPLPILFLVASHPEQTIRDAFNAEPLRSTTRRLALDEFYRPDIKLFL